MSNSVIRLICPNLKCRKVLSVPAHARGRNVRCRACSMRVTVPGKGAGKKQPTAVVEPTDEQLAGNEAAAASNEKTE
ncbi:hypothetical protein [Poriferisphaera sp. WC338]|uniref:hypothetical protein n=1 Tax=Poriferisphaera sp. WC338 TaxID=3425129 RepID=UPI003D81399B